MTHPGWLSSPARLLGSEATTTGHFPQSHRGATSLSIGQWWAVLLRRLPSTDGVFPRRSSCETSHSRTTSRLAWRSVARPSLARPSLARSLRAGTTVAFVCPNDSLQVERDAQHGEGASVGHLTLECCKRDPIHRQCAGNRNVSETVLEDGLRRRTLNWNPFSFPGGHVEGTKSRPQNRPSVEIGPGWDFPVVGTGVDPVTSRFSGARSTN
jgi:hypothetical protein